MKLSKLAILVIKGSEVDFKERLAEAIGVSIQTFYRYVVENDDSLTKASVLKLIRIETGLSDDQILEEETIGALK